MVVLLDTNAVSGLIRNSSDSADEAWAVGCPLEDLFFVAVDEAGQHCGAAILPTVRRRVALIWDRMLRDTDRLLPFDGDAARAYADVAVICPPDITVAYCRIAAISCSRGMGVATRNVHDFENTRTQVIDPLVVV